MTPGGGLRQRLPPDRILRGRAAHPGMGRSLASTASGSSIAVRTMSAEVRS